MENQEQQQHGENDGDNGQDLDHPDQNPNHGNQKSKRKRPMTYPMMKGNADADAGAGDAEFDDYFPPGYRFMPKDEELFVHYLRRKSLGKTLPLNRIKEVNLYRFNPMTLAETFKPLGEKEWYFFTPRDRKYKNGTRPNRAAGDGFWKVTQTDKIISIGKKIVGFKKVLVFNLGKPPKGNKTDWLMQEYRLDALPRIKKSADDMRLDDWVLCKIYMKKPHTKFRLLSSLTSSQQDASGFDDQQSDTSDQSHCSSDVGGEASSTPRGSGGTGISDVPGYHYNVPGMFPYHGFATHNVSDSQGKLPGMPNHNASISDLQGRLTRVSTRLLLLMIKCLLLTIRILIKLQSHQ